jgi:hypothetical protein
MFVSLAKLHQALATRQQDLVLEIAAPLRHVPLRYAARIVALLADGKHPRYKASADRFLVRVIEEVQPPLIQTKRLADVLAHVHHYYYQHAAIAALHDVVGQLHQRDRRLSLDFEADS